MELEQIKKTFHQHVRELQDLITAELQRVDPQLQLQEDPWSRKDFTGQEGGGGLTRAFQGDVIENAGVNTSQVYGAVDPQFAQQLLKVFAKTSHKQDEHDEREKVERAMPPAPLLWAAGISLIIHPRNPRVPTVHANFRLIHVQEKNSGISQYWFGGGADLTPYYPHEDDFRYFHGIWKEACAPYGVYPQMKKTCDEYFVNTHRNGEMRGIGGIFFDHLNSGNLERDHSMVHHLSQHFIKSYFPLVDRRKDEAWTPEDEDFQLHRRGRYVEFNLLHDRGTHFGLRTGGRTDSILISLPARCRFTYRYEPPTGSPHARMMEFYRPREWAN